MGSQDKVAMSFQRQKVLEIEILDSRFNVNLCCDHRWLYILNEKQEHTGNEYCKSCGATCVRDRKTGEIMEYDAVAAFRPTQNIHPRPQRPDRRRDRGPRRQERR